MAKKDPAFLFYSSDFLTGCTDLTMEERGQYITMMALQHQKGHLSEKTIRLSVGNVSVDVRNKFLVDESGNLYNKILDEVIEERRLFTESRRANGSKGGRPKKEEKPSGSPSENLHEDENEDESINKKQDPYINDNKSFYEKEYEKVFGMKPYISNLECNKLYEIVNTCSDFKERLPELLNKLKRLNFEDIGFNPDSSWLLNPNKTNFSALYNGTYDNKVKKTKAENRKEEVSEENSKEEILKEKSKKIKTKKDAILFVITALNPFIKHYKLTDKQIKDANEIWFIDWVIDLVSKFNFTKDEFVAEYRKVENDGK